MKRDKAKQFCHVVASLIFLLLAFYIFETHDLLVSCSAVAIGSVFMVVAGIHKWLMKSKKNVSLLFIFLEAATLFLSAYYFLKVKTSVIPVALAIFAALYLIMGIYFLATKKKSGHRHRSRGRKNRSFQGSSHIPGSR